jgi:serine/threonine protein phosphatase PrpC
VTGYDDIEYATLTDVGVRRSHNQDAYAALPASDLEQWQGRGHVFMVADGMGAHAVGELASKLAADSIPHIYSKHAHEGPVAALRKAFIETNLNIHTRGQQNREFEGMGTTATAMLIRPEGAWIGHVGDSRAYRVRNGKIEQLSFDHSLIWELARRQHKNPDELQGIPSNVIVRSLGPEPLVQVDVEGPHPIRPGDFFVLCSDGLSGPVTDREIGAVVTALPPAEACRFLVNLANLQGGPDNITAVVVRVGQSSTPTESVNGKQTQPLFQASKRPSLLMHGADLLKRAWPFAMLLIGILLAMGAIALTIQVHPVRVPAFVLAAAAILAGVTGLVIQSFREKQERDVEVHVPRIKVYRQTPCAIDRPFVQRLDQAVKELEQRIRDMKWHADWAACQSLREEGDRHVQAGDLLGAFRAQCRAMMVLMEAVQQQRGKEEFFRPLWD